LFLVTEAMNRWRRSLLSQLGSLDSRCTLVQGVTIPEPVTAVVRQVGHRVHWTEIASHRKLDRVT
jgi:hypothetical protein